MAVFFLRRGLAPTINIVNYLKSDGTQYIDSGVAYDSANEYVIETECCWTSSSSTFSGWNAGGIFGYDGGYWGNGSTMSILKATTLTKIKLTIEAGSSSNSVMELDQNGSTTTITRTHGSIASYATTNYPIFAYTNNSGGILGYAPMMCTYLSITVNRTLVRDFKPCLDSSGVACMYDLVSRKYFYNAGTGSFEAG